jgi:hypothetical protein
VAAYPQGGGGAHAQLDRLRRAADQRRARVPGDSAARSPAPRSCASRKSGDRGAFAWRLDQSSVTAVQVVR